MQWQRVSHLPGAVAALAAQVLAVGQQPGRARTLEGQPWIDEGRGATVVIHKEGLRIEMQNTGGHEKKVHNVHIEIIFTCGTPRKKTLLTGRLYMTYRVR